MRIDAVIFDMDGLMIDTETPVQVCCQAAAADMGLTLDDEFYEMELVGRGWHDCDRALTLKFGTSFSCSEFRHRFQRKWTDHLRDSRIEVKPGFRELFAFLRTQRVPVAVATSTHADDARLSLAAAGVSETFDAFVTGDEVARGKPHPEIYLTAAARLGVAPAACVVLEDSSAGALAASRAGMTTLLVPDGGRVPTSETVNAVFRVVASLHDAKDILSTWMNAR